MKRGHPEDSYTDPVCGMELSQTTAVEEMAYHGRIYYFCAPICRDKFAADPERYTDTRSRREERES